MSLPPQFKAPLIFFLTSKSLTIVFVVIDWCFNKS